MSTDSSSTISQPQELPLDVIRTDGGTQPRSKLDDATLAEYAESLADGACFPPVIVFFDGVQHWLADGFHRDAVHRRACRTTIPALVYPGTLRAAKLYAAGANANHGLRRSNEDKRRAVLTMLEDEEWSKWSNREIARRCRVSDVFVGKLRDSVTANVCSDNANGAQRTFTTKHGTPATMNIEQIGKSRVKAEDGEAAHRQRAKQLHTCGASLQEIARELFISTEKVKNLLATTEPPTVQTQPATVSFFIPCPLEVLRDAGCLDEESLTVLLSIHNDYGDEVLSSVPEDLSPSPSLDRKEAWHILHRLRPLAEPPLWPFAISLRDANLVNPVADAAVVASVQDLTDGMIVAKGYPQWAITATWYGAMVALTDARFGKDNPLSGANLLRSCVERWRCSFQAALAFYFASPNDTDDDADEELDDSEKAHRKLCRKSYRHDLKYAGVLPIIAQAIENDGVLFRYPKLEESCFAV